MSHAQPVRKSYFGMSVLLLVVSLWASRIAYKAFKTGWQVAHSNVFYNPGNLQPGVMYAFACIFAIVTGVALWVSIAYLVAAFNANPRKEVA